MRQYLRHLAVLLLLLPAAGHAGETVFDDLRIEPALGRHYRPGSWIMIRVSGYAPPGLDSSCVPELHLTRPGEEIPLFVSRLPAVKLQKGDFFSFRFWVIGGAIPPRLRFVLATPASLLRSQPLVDFLNPLAASERLCLSIEGTAPPVPGGKSQQIRDIPSESVLYASCDLLTLGSINRRKSRSQLKKSQLRAIGEWARRGGIILVFDEELGEQLNQALSFTTPLFPFTLPVERRDIDIRPSPPPARRVGRGLIVYLTGGSFSQRGLAVWKRLKREYLPTRRDDFRLAGERYGKLGLHWPPPAPSETGTGKWLLVWLISCFALMMLPVVRRRRWRAAATVVVVSTATAFLFVKNNPLSQAKVVRALVRTVDATGTSGPSQDEQLWVVTPFGQTMGRLTIPFRGWPPPVLLAENNNELMNTAVILTADIDNYGGVLGIAARGRGLPAVRRGIPLMFSQSGIGVSVPRQQRRLLTSQNGVDVAPGEESSPPLYSVLLTARGEKKVRLPVWSRNTSGVFAWQEYETFSPRQQIMQMFAAENKPGDYATLLGWEEKDQQDSNLGVLQIHGLTHVVNE